MQQTFHVLNSNTGEEVDFVVDKQTIIPLERPQEEDKPEEPKSLAIRELIEQNCNNVIAFVINWIKKSYTKDLLDYLDHEYKNEIINEITNKLKK